MRDIWTIITYLSILFYITACNENGKTSDKDKALNEKENELLKKENELLKKEQELNNKNKQSNSNQTEEPKSNNSGWKTFNHKYGFSIQLPNYFTTGVLTASALQYYTTDLDNSIMIAIETIGEGSQAELIKSYQMRIKSEEGISYKVLADKWFVISGKNSESIYYYKEIIKNNQTHFLMINYPPNQKNLMDNIIPRISKSFN